MLSNRRAFAVFALSSAFLSIGAACGVSTGDGPVAVPSDGADSGIPDARSNDASAQNDTGAQGDAEPDADPEAPAGRLVEGDVTLRGVTTDDHVVFTRKTNAGKTALEAISLADGVVTSIWDDLPASFIVSVKGNAVAIWSNVAPLTGMGMLSIWTPGGTLARDVEPLSQSWYFWASDDGKLVAYYGAGTSTSTDLVERDTSAGVSTTILTGDDRVSFMDEWCGALIDFVGNTLIATYCNVDSSFGRLITVADSPTKTARVLAQGIQSWWSADATASKIFVISQDRGPLFGVVIANDGSDPPTREHTEPNVNRGFLTKDGSAAVYTVGSTLRRCVLGGDPCTPVTIANDMATQIWATSADRKTILYSTLPGVPVDPQNPDGARYTDLRVADTSTPFANTHVLVATESAIPIGFSANGQHALFFSNGPKLNAIGVDAAGQRSMPAQFKTLDVLPTGAGAILDENERTVGDATVTDLVHVDFAAGDPASGTLVRKVIAESVVSHAFAFGNANPKALVFVRAGDTPGLYRASLP